MITSLKKLINKNQLIKYNSLSKNPKIKIGGEQLEINLILKILF
jgi:hypothetical protein